MYALKAENQEIREEMSNLEVENQELDTNGGGGSSVGRDTRRPERKERKASFLVPLLLWCTFIAVVVQ